MADTALNGHAGHEHDEHRSGSRDEGGGTEPELHCVPKSLPERLLVPAADTAIKINPLNAPNIGPVALFASGGVAPPAFIAVLVSKYWGRQPRRLSVSFMESTPPNLRARIVSHLNAWSQSGGISFAETGGTGHVRISRGPGGYWSYLGTDILHIPANRPTMNLEGFTMNTPDSEFRRVVRHEAGHTLGFPHEHMRAAIVNRIDRKKAYDFFRRVYGWDATTVDQQVLTPLDERSLMGTPPDVDSIMCYQLPGEITKDGRPIPGGPDINASDRDFCAQIYPKTTAAGQRAGMAAELAAEEGEAGDWDAAEDVPPAAIAAQLADLASEGTGEART